MIDIKLGSKVRDNVTGIEGIAVCRLHYLNGCVRYEVQPRGEKDGSKIEALWADAQQLEILTVPVADEDKPSTGGPGSTPPRHHIPS